MKLIERFINLKDDRSEKEQYFDEVVNIMQDSYKNVPGGCPSNMAKYLKPDYFWKLLKRDGKIIAAIIYKITGKNLSDKNVWITDKDGKIDEKELQNTKTYTAMRQPISAVLAIMIQLGLLTPIDKGLDVLINKERATTFR